jgi:hypothetical protein
MASNCNAPHFSIRIKFTLGTANKCQNLHYPSFKTTFKEFPFVRLAIGGRNAKQPTFLERDWRTSVAVRVVDLETRKPFYIQDISRILMVPGEILSFHFSTTRKILDKNEIPDKKKKIVINTGTNVNVLKFDICNSTAEKLQTIQIASAQRKQISLPALYQIHIGRRSRENMQMRSPHFPIHQDEQE